MQHLRAKARPAPQDTTTERRDIYIYPFLTCSAFWSMHASCMRTTDSACEPSTLPCTRAKNRPFESVGLYGV